MNKSRTSGYLFTLAAFGTWGFLPAYLRLLSPVSPAGVLAYRALWSFLVSAALLALTGRLGAAAAVLRTRRGALHVLATGALLGVNWFIYVWLIDQGRVVEASLGYFINPLFNICLGMLVLHERLARLQWLALLLAGLGLVGLTLVYGFIPWLSLSLTLTFGIYGLMKKTMSTDSLVALAGEMLVMLPFAAGLLVFGGADDGQAARAWGLAWPPLLVGCGLISALPLYWFAQGAKRIPLTSVGFMQYLAPTIMLAWSVLVFGESFSAGHLASFCLIWTALVLYTVSLFRKERPAG